MKIVKEKSKNRPYKDLVNKKYGRLTVMSLHDRVCFKNEKRIFIRWKVKCDCGNEKIVLGYALTRSFKSTKSCGCIGTEKVRKKPGEATLNNLLAHYKLSAKYRKIDFDLSLEEFKTLTKGNCFYCNS